MSYTISQETYEARQEQLLQEEGIAFKHYIQTDPRDTVKMSKAKAKWDAAKARYDRFMDDPDGFTPLES